MNNETMPLVVCRLIFVIVIGIFILFWSQLEFQTRFYVIVFGIAGTTALASSRSRYSLASKLFYLGWSLVALGILTALTGYNIGWQHLELVEKGTSIGPILFGAGIIAVAWLLKGSPGG